MSDTQKFPDTPGSLEGNTEGPGTASSENSGRIFKTGDEKFKVMSDLLLLLLSRFSHV